MVARLRGSAGVKQRRIDRVRHPNCVRCEAEGKLRVTEVIDHIVPLAKGGSDAPGNKQGLCRHHHDEKTAEDFGYRLRPTIGLDGWPVQSQQGGGNEKP